MESTSGCLSPNCPPKLTLSGTWAKPAYSTSGLNASCCTRRAGMVHHGSGSVHCPAAEHHSAACCVRHGRLQRRLLFRRLHLDDRIQGTSFPTRVKVHSLPSSFLQSHKITFVHTHAHTHTHRSRYTHTHTLTDWFQASCMGWLTLH